MNRTGLFIFLLRPAIKVGQLRNWLAHKHNVAAANGKMGTVFLWWIAWWMAADTFLLLISIALSAAPNNSSTSSL